MELPDDVLAIIRDYAKPSEPYKMYLSVMKILLNKTDLKIRECLMPKLKKAIRFHYQQFLHLFLELEKRHTELVVSVQALCVHESSIGDFIMSNLRKVYYNKVKRFTSINCDVMHALNKL
jgi:hypothetical protein